jgi:hypothetical protein
LVVTDPEPAPPTGQAHQVRRGEASAGDRDAVVLAQIDESFHQVGGGVVHETLLRLGHSVEIREGPLSNGRGVDAATPRDLQAAAQSTASVATEPTIAVP